MLAEASVPKLRKVSVRQQLLTVVLCLICMNLLLFYWQMTWGPFQSSPWQVLRVAFGWGDAGSTFIILELRMPRAVLAPMVGAGLALSGAIVQAICRNPLASPGTLGINAGASLGAVLVLVVFPSLPLWLLPIAVASAGLAAAMITYAFGWTGASSSTRLILAGVGVGVFFSALTSIALIFGKLQLVSQATVWITGSVYGAKWSDVQILAIGLIALIPLAFVAASTLDVLAMGRNIATGLGSAVERDRAVLLLLAVALASICVAVSGPIGFVGLMAPHMARLIVGGNYRRLLPIAALAGASIVQAADLMGRTAFAPYEIPAGIYTAAIGAPFLVYLLARR